MVDRGYISRLVGVVIDRLSQVIIERLGYLLFVAVKNFRVLYNLAKYI